VTLSRLKNDFLAIYQERLTDDVGAIAAGTEGHQAKAKDVNTRVKQVHDELRAGIAESGATTHDIQQQLLVLQYCTSVASLEYRHQVWPYEYMALSRRVGELWERFCSAAWDSPSKPAVARVKPPNFAEVEKRIRDRLAHREMDDEARMDIDAAFDVLFELVGKISMKEDEVFTVSGIPHVIDFKSGFGSNEKGNTLRLLTVGRSYKLWNPSTQLFFLVRQEANNNYLNVIRRSRLWDVRCGTAAYQTIDDLTGAEITSIRDNIVNFERDLSPEFWHYLSTHLSDLRAYLRW
jgi:hypothetical protein